MLAIRVWASEMVGGKLDLHYDPPPSAWKFMQTYPPVDMRQVLENEIAEVVATFTHKPLTSQTSSALVFAVRNILHRWQNNRWLVIDSGHERL